MLDARYVVAVASTLHCLVLREHGSVLSDKKRRGRSETSMARRTEDATVGVLKRTSEGAPAGATKPGEVYQRPEQPGPIAQLVRAHA